VDDEDRYPRSEESGSHFNSLRGKIDGEPLRDEKENRIGKTSRDDRPPGLRQFQQVAPARTGRALLPCIRITLVGHDHAEFGLADERVAFWRMIKPSPDDEPEETEGAGNHERGTPSPSRIDRIGEVGGNCGSDGGTAVKERRCQASFTLRKPFRDGFRRGWP